MTIREFLDMKPEPDIKVMKVGRGFVALLESLATPGEKYNGSNHLLFDAFLLPKTAIVELKDGKRIKIEDRE